MPSHGQPAAQFGGPDTRFIDNKNTEHSISEQTTCQQKLSQRIVLKGFDLVVSAFAEIESSLSKIHRHHSLNDARVQ